MKKFLVTVLGCCLFASIAHAEDGVARLSATQGKVLVNKGEGFVLATADMALSASDQLMVGEDSSAVVSYESCAVMLAQTTVFSVTADAPCADGQKLANIDAMIVIPAESTQCLPGQENPADSSFQEKCRVSESTTQAGAVNKAAAAGISNFVVPAIGGTVIIGAILYTIVADDEPASTPPV